MAKQLKKRTWAGAVCEQVVYTAADNAKVIPDRPSRNRFHNEEERAEHSRMISRRHHAMVINANYGPSSLYSTLTFNNENECHTYEECRQLRDAFYRVMMRKYPEAKINIYMGEGKNTHRFHLHMISDGVPEEFIREKWKYGNADRIERLREHNYYDGTDHGQDYTGLANYCFDHWNSNQGKGKRYKQSRTVKQPEEEKAKECVREYTPQKPPVTPKGYQYIGCEYNKYGYMLFKYVLIPKEDTERKNRRNKRLSDAL